MPRRSAPDAPAAPDAAAPDASVDQNGVPLPRRLAERIRPVRSAPPAADGQFVLYWMHNALRAAENPALDAALCAGDELGLPAFVYHAISERYAFASDRHHTFMLEGARDMQRGAGGPRRRLRLSFRTPGPPGAAPQNAGGTGGGRRHGGDARRTGQSLLKGLTTHLDGLGDATAGPPVWSVDTSCIVPMPLVDARPDRAFKFKKSTAKLRKARLKRVWEDVPTPHKRGAGGPFVPDDLPFKPMQFTNRRPAGARRGMRY